MENGSNYYLTYGDLFTFTEVIASLSRRICTLLEENKSAKMIPTKGEIMTELEKIISTVLKLSSNERIRLLTIIMRHVIETGEVEANSIRTTLDQYA